MEKSARPTSIAAHADVNTTVLTQRPVITVPKGNNTTPTIPNTRRNVGSCQSSKNIIARRVAGNRHMPSPINSAPCTRWTCKRTAYIGPKTADNDTSHRVASINGMT